MDEVRLVFLTVTRRCSMRGALYTNQPRHRQQDINNAREAILARNISGQSFPTWQGIKATDDDLGSSDMTQKGRLARCPLSVRI
jgi:hypothetical protein